MNKYQLSLAIDEEIIDKLKASAAKNKRSLAQEVRYVLERYTEGGIFDDQTQMGAYPYGTIIQP